MAYADDNWIAQLKHSGAPDLLGAVLETFPFIPPAREVAGENGNFVVEWQCAGKYFEIEDAGDGTLAIMTEIDGVYRHWVLTPQKQSTIILTYCLSGQGTSFHPR